MNGAQLLLQTLIDGGVDTCFANPGTSEMHFVAALDAVPAMRAVLTLFEGVATGAADGFGRMADKPAATLLHLGPGLNNGLANLHNARRARTPIVNVIGDHAIYHKRYDAPLESDIEAFARPVSRFVHTVRSPAELGDDARRAIAAARGPEPGIASLILPADVSWSAAEPSALPPSAAKARAIVPSTRIDEVVRALRSGRPCALLLGGSVLRQRGLEAATRVAAVSGAKLFCETFPARLERGEGVPAIERLNYFGEMVLEQLKGLAHLIVVDTKAPVSFFAYPDKPSDLTPDGCQLQLLAAGEDDAEAALEALADALGASGHAPNLQPASRPDLPSGALNPEAIARTIGALLPEGAIVSDEGNTAGVFVSFLSAGAPPHSWLCLTGGSIGQGMPLAVGAAVACPSRKVVSLEGDGSAMYTLQALWTQAREQLDVTTVILSNRSYAILNLELGRVGAGAPGPRALSMLDLQKPTLDFVMLARALGVRAERATNAEDFTRLFRAAMAEAGPSLIEAIL